MTEWEKRLRPLVSRRRSELITKSIIGKLTTEEAAELSMLQEYIEDCKKKG